MKTFPALFYAFVACCLSCFLPAQAVGQEAQDDVKTLHSQFSELRREVENDFYDYRHELKEILDEEDGLDERTYQGLSKKYRESGGTESLSRLKVLLLEWSKAQFQQSRQDKGFELLADLQQLPGDDAPDHYMKRLGARFASEMKGEDTGDRHAQREVIDLYGELIRDVSVDEPDTALEIYDRHLARYEDIRDAVVTEDLGEAMRLIGEAWLYRKHDEVKACAYYRKAADLYEKFPSEELPIESYMAAAEMAYVLSVRVERLIAEGRYDEALAVNREAGAWCRKLIVEGAKRYPERMNADERSLLINVVTEARIHEQQGNWAKAFQCVQDMEREYADSEDLTRRMVLMELTSFKAVLHDRRFDYRARDECCRKVVELARELEPECAGGRSSQHAQFHAHLMYMLGYTLYVQREWKTAMRTFELLEEEFGSRDTSDFMILMSFSRYYRMQIHLEQGDYDKVVPMCEELVRVELFPILLEEPRFQLASGAMGVYALKEQGREREALAMIEKLDGIREKAIFLTSGVRAMLRHFEAYKLSKTNREAEAMSLYGQLADEFERSGNPDTRDVLAMAMMDKAELDLKAGNTSSARQACQLVVERLGRTDAPFMRRVVDKARATLGNE